MIVCWAGVPTHPPRPTHVTSLSHLLGFDPVLFPRTPVIKTHYPQADTHKSVRSMEACRGSVRSAFPTAFEGQLGWISMLTGRSLCRSCDGDFFSVFVFIRLALLAGGLIRHGARPIYLPRFPVSVTCSCAPREAPFRLDQDVRGPIVDGLGLLGVTLNSRSHSPARTAHRRNHVSLPWTRQVSQQEPNTACGGR